MFLTILMKRTAGWEMNSALNVTPNLNKSDDVANLYFKVISAANTKNKTQPIVFLHGWGSDQRTWQPLVDGLTGERDLILFDLPGFGGSKESSIESIDQFINAIVDCLSAYDGPFHFVGWSLGGMLAQVFAEQKPELVTSVVSVASNARFVASEEWPSACLPEVFQQFVDGFIQDSKQCRKKFSFLHMQGDSERKFLQKFFRSLDGGIDVNQESSWLRALRWLNEIDNRNLLAERSFSHLAIFGEEDALVPVNAVADFLKNKYADEVVQVCKAGHAPHVSQSSLVAKKVVKFLRQQENPFYRDKQEVARAFSRASRDYESIAGLQSDVAIHLCTLKENYSGEVCDLGSGTGFTIKEILNPKCNVTALDIAPGMIKACRSQPEFTHNNKPDFVCGDYESLPFSENAFEGVVSSMSFQWASQLESVFEQVKRVIKPGGYLLFSTLGPTTLHELKTAWKDVDDYVHVNEFESKNTVIDALEGNGFQIEQFESENKTLFYTEALTLMRELKGIGAHNVNAGKRHSVTTRGQIKQVAQSYEQFRQANGLPATYEVYYVLAKVPEQ